MITVGYKSVDASFAPLFRRHCSCKAAFGMDNDNVRLRSTSDALGAPNLIEVTFELPPAQQLQEVRP